MKQSKAKTVILMELGNLGTCDTFQVERVYAKCDGLITMAYALKHITTRTALEFDTEALNRYNSRLERIG